MKLTYLESNSDIKQAIDLLKEIESHGYQAFIVGGVVRDMVIFEHKNIGILEIGKKLLVQSRKGGANFHDIDIATNMPIEELEKHFTTRSNNGEKHGTILIGWGKDIFGNNKYYEVTQFRTDGTYTDGRHPDSITFTSSFQEDVLRRDFTMNALGLDSSYNVIDYVGGISDITNKIIRTVGNPDERFEEDQLRILRALRFQNQLRYVVDPGVCNAMVKNLSNERFAVAPERSIAELLKMTWNKDTIKIVRSLNLFRKAFNYTWLDASYKPFAAFLNLENDFELSGREFLIFLVLKNNRDAVCLGSGFKMTRDDVLAGEFIEKNKDVIRDFWENPYKTLKISESKYFPLLNKYWFLFYSEQRKAQQIGTFNKFTANKVVDEKLINRVVCSKGYRGPKIGIMKERLINFYLLTRPTTPITEDLCKTILDIVDEEYKKEVGS